MKKNIAVIFGGKSAEHDVSIITAHTPIISALEATSEFNVWPIYISKEGAWYSSKKMNDIGYFKGGDMEIENKLKKEKKIQLGFDEGLQIIWPGLMDKRINIDIAFPAMHGTYGEDGSLMGILRMANIPFVGCDLSASAVAMDKIFTKQLLENEDIPVVPYIWFVKSDWENKSKDIKKRIKDLNYPVFVKPAHLGSSIAITKAKNDKELENAIEVALHYDNKVLVEESIEDLIEVTLPIIGHDDKLQLAFIERPLNRTEFFNFEDKYVSDSKKGGGVNRQYSELPAKIDENMAEKVKTLSKKTFKILGCSGIARVDLLIDNSESRVYVNEVNTLPGSLYSHNWRQSGVSDVDLVIKLIKIAEDRYSQNKDITYTFNSNILDNLKDN